MRVFALQAFVIAALTMSLPSASAADVVVTMNSYGPIHVGMTVAEAHEQLRKLGRKNLPSPRSVPQTGCAYYRASDDLKFMTEDRRIVRIETREASVVTPSGLRVGSSLDKVRRTLGSRIVESQQKYATDPAERSIVLVSGDRKFAIRVEGKDAVGEIFVGSEPAIWLVEGCG